MCRGVMGFALVLVMGGFSMLHAQNAPPPNPQNRLPFVAEDKMTPALRQALAEYKKVRPDGLAPGRSGGPSLWSVYVHLPEILTPLRQLHEQVHVNPRLSQKLIHFVILITGRYWTNDIWTAHDEDGIKEGLSRETVKAIEEGHHPGQMPEDEEIIYAFCRELLTNKRVSDETYAKALSKFGPVQLSIPGREHGVPGVGDCGASEVVSALSVDRRHKKVRSSQRRI